MSNGKGDKARPKSVDQKTWDKNFEAIFGQKKKKKAKDKNER